MYYRLDPQEISFPHPQLADEDGVLAIGGDLSQERLLLAYQHGIFPWFEEDSPIVWYAPAERFVLAPQQLKVSKSMQQLLRQQKFQVRKNHNFAAVIEACAAVKRKDQDGTWITDSMQEAYIALHRSGYAHSIETYNEHNELVGGLYGVKVGSIFCGESMFSSVANSSKLALIHLCREYSLELIDCQIPSAHLTSMGAKSIDGADFYARLQQQKMKAHDL